jgi:hypothetical protein
MPVLDVLSDHRSLPEWVTKCVTLRKLIGALLPGLLRALTPHEQPFLREPGPSL